MIKKGIHLENIKILIYITFNVGEKGQKRISGQNKARGRVACTHRIPSVTLLLINFFKLIDF